MNEIDQKVCDAKILLMLFEPVYGIFASFMQWKSFDFSQIPGSSQTMGVRVAPGGIVECLYQPEFVRQLTKQELASVIQHEIEHVVRFHCTRQGNHFPILWNIAADMAINGHRSSPKFGYVDEKGIRHLPIEDQIVWLPEELQNTESTEEIYRKLILESKRNPNNKELYKAMNCQSKFRWDNHTIWDSSDPNTTEAQQAISHIAERASNMAQGNAPASWQETIKQTGESKVRWESILRAVIARFFSGKQTSYGRQNRRNPIFGSRGTRQKPQNTTNIILDTSGSVSSKMLEAFFNEIQKLVSISSINVLQWDYSFQSYETFKKGKINHFFVKGRGGTDMEAPFLWLEKNKKVADLNILFTDGYCNWPSKKNYAVLPVICGNAKGPTWTKSIRITD